MRLPNSSCNYFISKAPAQDKNGASKTVLPNLQRRIQFFMISNTQILVVSERKENEKSRAHCSQHTNFLSLSHGLPSKKAASLVIALQSSNRNALKGRLINIIRKYSGFS
jgi:hypothetical protein